jgi:endonuclease/exonuclease/phosphatase family metal-dependent hydrolase
MTYNVHGCRGTDGRVSHRRIADVIAAENPDIVALQELDVGRHRSQHIDQAEQIAHDLDMSVHFHPSVQMLEEKYGDAILTRWPLRLQKAGLLPGWWMLPRLEPRGALWVEVDIDGVTLQMFNTHLGLIGRERRAQVAALLGSEWIEHQACRGPIVMAGDFNLISRSSAYRRISTMLTDVQRTPAGSRPRRTFPSRYPRLRIDYIFVSPSVYVVNVATPVTPLSRIASDHLPVIADLQISHPPVAVQDEELLPQERIDADAA